MWIIKRHFVAQRVPAKLTEPFSKVTTGLTDVADPILSNDSNSIYSRGRWQHANATWIAERKEIRPIQVTPAMFKEQREHTEDN